MTKDNKTALEALDEVMDLLLFNSHKLDELIPIISADLQPQAVDVEGLKNKTLMAVVGEIQSQNKGKHKVELGACSMVDIIIDHLNEQGYLQSPPEPQWQTIDTAPKDGTSVFVHSVKWCEPTMMYYNSKEAFEKDYGDPNYMEEGWYISHGMDFDQPDEYTRAPTHWMPLSQPPKGAGE